MPLDTLFDGRASYINVQSRLTRAPGRTEDTERVLQVQGWGEYSEFSEDVRGCSSHVHLMGTEVVPPSDPRDRV
jgi:hypothetical protein